MAYVIIRDINSEYRVHTTLEELQILKIANSKYKNYSIKYVINPKIIKVLVNLFGEESYSDSSTSKIYSSYKPSKFKLLEFFCEEYIPSIMNTLKSDSFLINIEKTLFMNKFNKCKNTKSYPFPYLYKESSKVLEIIELEKHRAKINKDIFNLISTYIIYPSIGYSETGFPVLGYPIGDYMHLPLAEQNIILSPEFTLSTSARCKIKDLLIKHPEHQAHILSFIKLHSLNLESDVYTAIL